MGLNVELCKTCECLVGDVPRYVTSVKGLDWWLDDEQPYVLDNQPCTCRFWKPMGVLKRVVVIGNGCKYRVEQIMLSDERAARSLGPVSSEGDTEDQRPLRNAQQSNRK